MTVRPARLNAASRGCSWSVGLLRARLGAGVRSTPSAGWVDGVTYFVGSVFFTSASYCQLVQAQSPGTTGVDAVTPAPAGPRRLLGWLPHDRNWLAAATQFPGTLFFNISTARRAHPQRDRGASRTATSGVPTSSGRCSSSSPAPIGILAVSGRFLRSSPARCRGGSRGSTCSARCCSWPRRWRATSCRTDEVLDTRLPVAGTLFGAVCFLVGAALMFPAWRRAVAPVPAHRATDPLDPLTRPSTRRSA